MKKHPIGVCVVFGVIIALGIVACTIAEKHGPGVYIHETYVEIYPGTKISSHDQRALDAVLKQFNKSFYKIRTYDRGKLVKTQGSLEDARVDQTLFADATKAPKQGFSHSTLQITWAALHTSNVLWMIHVPEFRDSKQLVSRVAPILQKYSQ